MMNIEPQGIQSQDLAREMQIEYLLAA